MTKINNSPADGYLVKYLSGTRGMNAHYFAVHADNPRDAVVKFQRLFPRAVVADVYPPPVPPRTWVE